MEICLLDILRKEQAKVDAFNCALGSVDFFKEQKDEIYAIDIKCESRSDKLASCDRLIAEYTSKAVLLSNEILDCRKEMKEYIEAIIAL